MLERWWAIQKLQLAADNIDAEVVRLKPAREADAAAAQVVLGAETEHHTTHHQGPVGMTMEVEGEEDLPDTNDHQAHRDKKRKRENDDGAAEAEAEEGEEEVTEAGSEEGPALLLHAAYLGTRIGSGDGGEGDNVGVRGPFALSSRALFSPLQLFCYLCGSLFFFSSFVSMRACIVC